MSYAPYPAYKDSGVPWLGQVPEGWETSRVDFQCTVKARLGWKGLTASEYVDEGYVFLATPNIKGNEIDFEKVNYINEQRYLESPEIMIQPGDVLLAKDGSTLGTTNYVRSLPRPATVNSSIAIVRPRKNNIDGAFLFRWIEADLIQSKIQQMKDGQGVPHLFQSDIRKFPLPLPPIEEQTAIAVFLDKKTAEIDDLIAKKEELLRLLAEQRTALITHAVTKGLNPNAPMKPSGVVWFDQVPEGWDVFPLSALAEIRTGFAFSSDDFVDEGGPLIRISDVGADGVVTVKGAKRLPSDYAGAYSRYQVFAGDLLMAMTGATVGKAGLYSEPETALLNQRVCLLRAKPNAETNFVRHLMNANFYQSYVRLTAFGGAQPNISDREIVACRVPVPPLDQQLAISDYLDRRIGETEKVAIATKRAIRKLKEYRTALITNAVTGKIKVA